MLPWGTGSCHPTFLWRLPFGCQWRPQMCQTWKKPYFKQRSRFLVYMIYIYMIHMIPWNYTYYGTNHILNKPYVKVLQKTKTKSNTIPSVRWVSDFWWWRAHTSGDEHQTQWVHKGNYEGCYRSLAGGFLALPEMNQSRKDHHRISWMEINTIWNRPAKICARRWFLEWIAVILKNQMWWNQR